MKKAVLLPILLYCFVSLGISQTMIVEPLGMSPRDVELGRVDTTFNIAYNGLLNVGTGTQMYLKGTFVDSFLTSPTWSVEGPVESSPTLGDPVDLDAATQAVIFIPDLEGTYVVTFEEGATSATITINAGTYVGGVLSAEEQALVGAPAVNCSACHSTQYTEWMGTGHYALFEEGMSGTASDHYGSSCISCHVTGYDTNAENGGFDEWGFVFPDSTDLANNYGILDGHFTPDVWDSLFVFYPEAMNFARIQCESCHGPGSEHMAMPPSATDNKIVASLSTDNCAWCHDSGTHHVFPEQWDDSGHANPPDHGGPWSASCARCHTPQGFIQYAKGEVVESGLESPFSCAMCHDPHSAATPHQVREVETVLSNGEPVKGGGMGKLCMSCHMSRRDADSYTESPGSHFGPHYGVQADVLNATNVVTFGRKLPTTSGHLQDDACVDCHMAEGHADAEGNIILAGSHTFSMDFPDSTDNVEACAPCHGEIGESFAEKKFFFNFNADHDGDGIDEGLQEEVHGLMEHLGSLLPSDDPHAEVDETWTKTELKAAYNHRVIYYDHSYGIHNPAFTVALLHTSIEALEAEYTPGAIVAIEDVPNDQGNQVRIIWEAFHGFEPVDFYVINRLDEWVGADTTWTTVGMLPAYEAERFAMVVPTVYNAPTTFEVVAMYWDESEMRSMPAAGESVDNLVPHAPVNPLAVADAAASSIALTWEAADDPDVNFYRIYRATSPGFVPGAGNEIATTVDLAYEDLTLGVGTYFYKIAAEDFNGNLGEFSTEVSAEILGINETGLPTEYSLEQNFPNPFNPSTNIKFQLREAGHVSMVIYDHIGREVLTLINQPMSAGYHNVSVGADRLASGVYFYRITVNDFTSTKKMLLLK